MKSILNALFFIILSHSAFGQIYVKKTATGLNNGTSWTNAYTNLQTAINNATSGSILYVAADTFYLPSGNRDNSFAITNKSLTIYGGFPNTGNPGINNRAHRIYHTILSGDVNKNDASFTSNTRKGDGDRSDNVKNVVRISNNNTNNTIVLDGLVIQSGNYFENGGIGSGVYVTKTVNGGAYTNVTIKNCTFRYNTGQKGAAVGTYQYFIDNGAMNIIMESNHFYENTSDEFPVFFTNISGTAGQTWFTLQFKSNVVFANTGASTGTGLISAISNNNNNSSSYFNFKINFNTFANNTLSSNCGVICAEGTNPTSGPGNVSSIEITNNLFKNNSSSPSVFRRSNGKKFYSTVFYDYNTLPATDSFDILYGGANNKIGTISFVSEAGNNYRLADCSPWINSGSNEVKSKDGSETLNISLPSKDAEDNPRVMNSIIDRGALEYFGGLLPSHVTINKTICAKDSFLFNGSFRKAPGTFKDTLTNASTCDSFITLNLIASNSSSTINRSICPGTSFTLGSKTLQTSGVYFDTLQNFLGCDSIVTCSLTVYSEASLSIGITPPNLTTLVATPGFAGYGWYRNDTLITTGVSNTYNFNGTKGVYKCAAIRVLGSAVCTTFSNPYSFGMTHTIQVISGPNGTVSPSGTFTKNSNDTLTFFITPNAGFKVDSLLINNLSVTPATSFFVNAVSSDFTFRAVFKSISSAITSEEQTDISIYPNPAQNTLFIKGINDIPRAAMIQSLSGQQIPCIIENKQIEVQQLPAGIYILKIQDKDQIKSTKFIKE